MQRSNSYNDCFTKEGFGITPRDWELGFLGSFWAAGQTRGAVPQVRHQSPHPLNAWCCSEIVVVCINKRSVRLFWHFIPSPPHFLYGILLLLRFFEVHSWNALLRVRICVCWEVLCELIALTWPDSQEREAEFELTTPGRRYNSDIYVDI